MNNIELALHIGAHKTATTYIQNTLLTNKKMLKQVGVSYLPLKMMRNNGLTRAIIDGKRKDYILDSVLKNVSDNSDRLIISEENLMGTPNQIVKHGSLYKRQINQIRDFINLIKPKKTRVLFVIRSYDEFFSSIYCEYLRHHKEHIPFKEFVKNFNVESFSWVNIIHELTNKIGSEKCVIYDYENFKLNNKKIFQFLVGKDVQLETGNQELRPRSSYYDKTIQVLDQLSDNGMEKEAAVLRDNINDRFFEVDSSLARYSAFSEEESNKLKKRYKEELKEIYSKFNTLSA